MNQAFAGTGGQGQTIYGMPGVGVIGLESERKRLQEHTGKFVVVTTASHSSKVRPVQMLSSVVLTFRLPGIVQVVDDLISLTQPDVVLREGGCGYKVSQRCLVMVIVQLTVLLQGVAGDARYCRCIRVPSTWHK
jgi:hypothetical protein